MKAPTQNRLQEYLGLSAEEARLVRKFAHAADYPDDLEELVDFDVVPGTWRYVRQMYSSPYDSYMWRTTVALHAINEIVGGHGVEALTHEDDGYGAPSYEYINTGDGYTATLIYDRDKDRLFIGSWADIVERKSGF